MSPATTSSVVENRLGEGLILNYLLKEIKSYELGVASIDTTSTSN